MSMNGSTSTGSSQQDTAICLGRDDGAGMLYFGVYLAANQMEPVDRLRDFYAG